MIALAGDDANPGIPTFDPDVGAELYTTNGDTNDHMYKSTKTISFTPERSRTATGSGSSSRTTRPTFRPSSSGTCSSRSTWRGRRADPTHPTATSATGPPNFVVDKFKASYGNPQTVQVNARRDLGRSQLKWRVNGGRTHRRSTSEWTRRQALRRRGRLLVPPHARAGRRHEAGRQREGLVRGAEEAREERLLHLQGPCPNFGTRTCWCSRSRTTPASRRCRRTRRGRSRTTSTTTEGAGEQQRRVRRVRLRRHGRKAPDPLGVLSHYDAVVWYTGNDNVDAEPAHSGRLRRRGVGDDHVGPRLRERGRSRGVSGVNAGRQWTSRSTRPGAPESDCDGNLQTTDGGTCNRCRTISPSTTSGRICALTRAARTPATETSSR